MTIKEFSDEFDILYNNINSNQAPGLNDYEKSIFLTKAQEELILSYYSNIRNKFGEGVDSTHNRNYDFSSLIKVKELNRNMEALAYIGVANITKFNPLARLYDTPDDLFLGLSDTLIDDTNRTNSIYSIQSKDYLKLLSKPYPYPPKRIFYKYTNLADMKSQDILVLMNADTYYTVLILNSNIDKNLQGNTLKFYIDVSTEHPAVSLIQHGDNACSIVTRGNTKIIQMLINPTTFRNFAIKYLAERYNSYEDANKAFNNRDSCNDLRTELSKYLSPITPIGFSLLSIEPTENTSIEYTYNTDDVYRNNTKRVFELFGKFNNSQKYYIRYIRIPKPIILTNLNSEDLSIRGYNKETECELPEMMHREILQRAVELAKASYEGKLADIVSMGQYSATDIGTTLPREQQQ